MFLNPYIAGNPIGGKIGFFGRDDILREVMQMLRHPESNAIVLYGQRRIGKTSTLLQLERQLTDAADYTPVYFDLQDKAMDGIFTRQERHWMGKMTREVVTAVGQGINTFIEAYATRLAGRG